MKLQSKVMLVIVSLWLIICLVIYIDSKITLESDYEKLEVKLAAKDINRVQRALENKLSALKLYTNSWSQWDDAYEFMLDKNQRFMTSSFVSGTFTSSDINFFLLFDTQGKFFDGRAYNLTDKSFISIPPGLLAYLHSRPNFVIHHTPDSGYAGFIKSPEGIVIMSSLPVLNSNGQGPVHGSLLIGYFLNDSFIKSLGDTVDLKINFISLPIASTDKSLNNIYSSLIGGKEFSLINQNTTIAYGFTLLKDIDGNPIGMLKIELARDLYSEGLITIYRYLAIVIILGVVIVLTTMYLLKHLILNRILSVSKQVIDINSEGKFHKRIKISGNDELEKMVSSINYMLELIELSQDQLKYRISRRTKDLERLSQLNRNLFNEMGKQKSIEAKLREDEKLLRQMAYYDTLTGLPNRAFFNELLQQAIMHAEHNHNKIAVLFVDIDHFKKINDTYGHEFGDKLLKQIAYRLKNTIKDTDVIAHLSGDEFILFLTNINDKDMIDAIIANIFQALTHSMKIDNVHIEPTYSIGISIYNEDASNIESLLKQADLAMYYAKKQEGNSFRYYGAIENLRSTSLPY